MRRAMIATITAAPRRLMVWVSTASIVPIDIAGIPNVKALRGIRCRQSTLPLEYVGNACDLAVGPYRRNAEPEPSLSKQGCTDFLLGSRTSASAECRHWSGRAVRWSSCAILLSAGVLRQLAGGAMVHRDGDEAAMADEVNENF
jgi:hypothetical protein